MVFEHTTKSGRKVWVCETCRKRRKTELAAKRHELTCRGRPRPKKNDYTNANLKTNYKKGHGYNCCVCKKNFKSIKVIGNHHICDFDFKRIAKENDGRVDLTGYKTYM